MSEQTTTGKGKMSLTQKILIAGLAVVLAAVVGVGALIYQKLNQPPPEAAPAQVGSGNLVVDDNFNPENGLRKAADNMFEVKMNATWNFPDGKSPSSDAYVANSTANNLPFYFEVSLKDTDEVVYTSPRIPLGSAVKEFPLDKELAAGDYEGVCTYHTLNSDGQVEDSISVAVRLSVAA